MKAQPQELLVARDGTRAGRRGRHGWVNPDESRRLEGERPRRHLQRSDGGVRYLQMGSKLIDIKLDPGITNDPVRSCPHCGGEISEPRAFYLMFKTYVGATEDESSITYLRPETAQSIFVQFKNVLEVSRKKLPFGIAQIGKA